MKDKRTISAWKSSHNAFLLDINMIHKHYDYEDNYNWDERKVTYGGYHSSQLLEFELSLNREFHLCVLMSVMRSTKADECRNSFHLPAAANQATVSLLNYMTFVFDVFSTRIRAEKGICKLWQLSWKDSRETLNEFQTMLSGNKWMDDVATAQTRILSATLRRS